MRSCYIRVGGEVKMNRHRQTQIYKFGLTLVDIFTDLTDLQPKSGDSNCEWATTRLLICWLSKSFKSSSIVPEKSTWSTPSDRIPLRGGFWGMSLASYIVRHMQYYVSPVWVWTLRNFWSEETENRGRIDLMEAVTKWKLFDLGTFLKWEDYC